jgi:uncharacterized protein YecE (DUF72 family)
MKFGHLEEESLRKVDFTLPADNPNNALLLSKLQNPTHTIAGYIGCSVWTDRNFIGKIYPVGTPAKDYLRLYSRHFNTVELNPTFYTMPSIMQVRKWQASVEKGFLFCPKIPRMISHSTRLDRQLSKLDDFLNVIQHLGACLGMIFLQLSPDFAPLRIQELQKLVEHIPKDFSYAIEFRNAAWFNDAILQQEVIDLLQQQQISTVITDVASRRDVLHQILTNHSVLIRFRGYATASNNYTRLDAWVARIKAWLAQGLKQVYFIVHETDKAFCLDLAIYFSKALNRETSLQVPIPRLEPRLGSLF